MTTTSLADADADAAASACTALEVTPQTDPAALLERPAAVVGEAGGAWDILVGLPLLGQIFGALPPAPGAGQLYQTLRKFPKSQAVWYSFRESLGKLRKVKESWVRC